MSTRIGRFYPIVDSAAWVERLIAAGAWFIQLRIKDQPDDRVGAEVRAAQQLAARHAAQLVVNDYWRIAIDEGCDFVHLGQGDLDGADIRAIRRAGIRIGVSTHDHDELERGLSIDPDYVALGPIYSTLLKEMPWAPQGLERLAEWKRRVEPIPLVAIGGLTVARLPDVFAAGADSAAVVTDIVRSEEPDKRAREWVAAMRALEGAGAREDVPTAGR